MANNLFISYDLHQPGQNYDRVIAAIKQLGGWAKVHYSFWFVSSECLAKEAAAHVWAVMDRGDRLLVVDSKTNDASWYNIDSKVGSFMQNKWSH